MDKQSRKDMIGQYKMRKPDKGIISFLCTETGEEFLGKANDIPSEFNGLKFKLSSGGHPNKRLQELWNTYGEEGFEITVACELEYEDPTLDYSEDLEILREELLAERPNATILWK